MNAAPLRASEPVCLGLASSLRRGAHRPRPTCRRPSL